MNLTDEQIIQIIKDNPNKEAVEFGVKYNQRMMKLTENFDKFFEIKEYFEDQKRFSERCKTTSGKDIISRITHKEGMVFNAKGGSVVYDGLSEQQQKEFNVKLNNIRLGMSLRSWIENFILKAYRFDPMGVIFIEKDLEGNPFPTYKTSQCIYDYSTNGQKVDYVMFLLSVGEALAFGVNDNRLLNLPKDKKSDYIRVVDDSYDKIFIKGTDPHLIYLDKDGKSLTKDISVTCPAYVISNLMTFTDTSKFVGSLDPCLELLEQFLNDRSIRDLVKKMHGFPKAVTATVNCKECQGTGQINGSECPKCNGTGQRAITEPKDIISIPLSMLAENTSLDIKKIFTYITPDIEGFKMMNDDVIAVENMAYKTQWGIDQQQQAQSNGTQTLQETATKTLSNLQPIYSKLENIAGWAENIESTIIKMMGYVLYPSLKGVSVVYGKDYILESSQDLFDEYLEMKAKGSPQHLLTDKLIRCYKSMYQTNPIQLGIKLKLINVEPFVHYSVQQVQAMRVSENDLKCKTYFSEWLSTMDDSMLLIKKTEELRNELLIFASEKTLPETAAVNQPIIKK